MNSVLDDLQTEVANVLSEDPTLAGIPVLSEDIHDLTYEVERAVYSLGIVVIVQTPTARRQNPNESGLYLEAVDLRVRVEENPRLNTGADAVVIAESVISALHLLRTQSVDEPLYADRNVMSLIGDDQLLIYEVPFTTEPPKG